MAVTPLYQPRPDRPMTVAGFLSGSGTNLVKIIEFQKNAEERFGQTTYEVACIFTDNAGSRAGEIGKTYGIPVIESDIMEFYRAHGRADKKDMSLRPEFDVKTVEMLKDREIDFVALAGYMSVVTGPLLAHFAGRIVNVHPADLRVKDGAKRRYTGDRAVASAIRRGETSLRSSVHIVREQVDYGELLSVSAPLPIVLPEGVSVADLNDPARKTLLMQIADEHQGRLKEYGDWVIYPWTLELISQGRFGLDENGLPHFDGKPAPDGIVIEDTPGPMNYCSED